MGRITRKGAKSKAKELSFRAAFDAFVTDSIAQGKADKTIKTYRTHLKSVEKHLDIDVCLSEITKSDLSAMIVSMRAAGLSANSISSYARVVNTFLTWAREQEYCDLQPLKYKQTETVKETYTDSELEKLLRRPSETCRFSVYRTWVVINFLINCGCRAATVRHIQIRDVDLEGGQVISRHNKNGKIQVLPLCKPLIPILRDYMETRGGEPADYLFPDEFGKQLSENALRLAIGRYNNARGVSKTSIHLFRHTFARLYLTGGGDAFMLQKLLNHSTLKMTRHYCNIFDSDVTERHDELSPLAQIKGKSRGPRIKR